MRLRKGSDSPKRRNFQAFEGFSWFFACLMAKMGFMPLKRQNKEKIWFYIHMKGIYAKE